MKKNISIMIEIRRNLNNYKYEIRIINIHQGLIMKGRITATREIMEISNTLDYETANYFYQNPLNRTPPIESIQIINLFEAKYEEPVEISKEELKEKSKLKNWYQSQVSDQGK